MGMVRLSFRVHEDLRALKHELSKKNRREVSFSDTISFLLEFYRKNRGIVERLVGL